MRRRPASVVSALLVAPLTLVLLPWTVSPAAAAPAELPVVSPAPQQMSRDGRDVVLTPTARVVTGPETDEAARDLLVETLESYDVQVEVGAGPRGRGLTFRLGDAGRADIAESLGETVVPDHAEGYALRVTPRGGREVVLAGVDGAGQYYAVQTLRQLIEPARGREQIAGVSISDYPAMPLRGTIEGFYGEPWTPAERLDQMSFYGDVKANTYVYAPKDDPYHRERWREPYPAELLAELADLVTEATAHHVRFTFALSPGNTVCYSDEADYQALVAKLQELYDVGVRAFSVPLDDIAYGQWNCDADTGVYGPAGAGPAGRAQTDLLNRIQTEFIETHPGTYPLQMVPTEYYNTTESAYKQALRSLDEDVVVMWTGEDVVPREVTVAQAESADEVFGGQVFLWDNYPVNDFGESAGRLLLAPYAEREAGLSDILVGIAANPMNQAAASKVAVFGVADFSWNDRDYRSDRNWVEAMRYLSGDDPEATEALLLFGDLNHLAPTFGAEPWQPPAPALAARTAEFWTAWESGDRAGAINGLRTYAEAMAAAPQTIRAGAVDPGFVSDAAPWLAATELWSRATLSMLDALQARLDGDPDRSAQLQEQSEQAQEEAAAVLVDPPDNRWGRAPVKIADGVLDRFLLEAGLALDLWELGGAENLAPQGVATASSVEQGLGRLAARNVNDGDPGTRWASEYSDTEWVQVQLAEPSVVSAVSLSWEAACADAYEVRTSVDGTTWTTAAEVTDSTCSSEVVDLDGDGPVGFVRIQGVDRRTDFGYSLWELGVYGPA